MTQLEFIYPLAKSLYTQGNFDVIANRLADSKVFESGLLISCLLATMQHLMYASVFYIPASAKFISSNHNSFIAFAYLLKITTVIFMAGGAITRYGLPDLSSPVFGIALCLLAYGCHLNIMVHTLLGTKVREY